VSNAASSVVSYSNEAYGNTIAPRQLPDPTGYRILVAPKAVEATTQTGIHLPDERVEKENDASIVFCVIKLGSDAYKDSKKFPDGPWCKEGDWIVLSSYAGTRFKVQGMEFRIINDDTVLAVIDDPRRVSRA
jgi:co-chaperonin GroES (HSP10)